MSDRARSLILAYEDEVCPRCGNLRSECSDEDVDWYPRTAVCFASATSEWAWRRLRKRHESDDPPEHALGELDGRWVWVSPVAPAPEADEFA